MSQNGTINELGTERIGKLLTQYAVPAIIAMTASSLYNMVDSIFIGHGVGPLAISGLAVTFPLMNLAAAFGSLVGVGASTLISVKLGQKDYDTAHKILGNVVVLNLLIGIVFTIVTLAFLDPILYFFGASEATLPYARDYMVTILLGNVVTHMYLGLNSVLRSAGHPQKAMLATIFTVVVNTILDPVFIYGFGWGIRGAAIATILAQILSLIWLFKIFCNKNEVLHFHRGIYRLKRVLVENIIGIGLAPFFMNVASCFIVILINKGLKLYDGDLAIGAFGIVNRISFLFVMIVMGLNQGMQPIAGYNFGAKQYHRVNQVMKLTVIAATLITTTGFLVGELMPKLAVSAFTNDETLINISAQGLRIVVMFFPIIGFQMVTSNFFQSIGMARKAIILSLSRQVLILIPCLIILPMFWDAKGVWLSMPISDAAASIIAAIMLYKQFQTFKRHAIEQGLTIDKQ
ncbi:MATE family efflux transporter [Phocaeicola barnesiae]|uniref:Multidrug export protein MepA n=1 Tax=Phocaeicola barnesiae TaxID=376804 RepID=A0AAW5N2W1_9BACT|nr:MATE family efflux transporter [Phocaeicola barnesiae]MCR8874707.1 MATE family efflux transporter [Phocaeicola barnesiae]MDM8253728.1 MATE family efflux transporter [Phocaeicola barnesiae]HJG78505.1 MATE family efflux transporter [Phocaeicola barnesiae]